MFLNKSVDSRLITVAVADGVPLEVGVSKVGGEGVDDMLAVVVRAAAAVRLRELSCKSRASVRSDQIRFVPNSRVT